MTPAMNIPGLSLALSGVATELGGGAEALRRAAPLARSAGCQAMTLDATIAGLRPRELDRSARRDLAAMLRRTDLASGGVDAFVPVGHLADPAHADRALAALLDAITLAGELALLAPGPGAATLNLALPDAPAQDLLSELAARAERHGVRLADFTPRDQPLSSARGTLGVGVDPAAILLSGQGSAGGDPAMRAAAAGAALAGARLSDADAGMRVAPGLGRLDIPAYKAALSVVNFAGPVALDLKRCVSPLSALPQAAKCW